MSKHTKSKKERRNSLIGTVVAGVGLIWLFGFNFWTVGLVALAAYGIGKAAGALTSERGMDLSSRNRQDQPPAPVEEIPATGNTTADDVIQKGQEMLRELREDNIDITDPELTRQMDILEEKCAQIFKTVAEEPEKAPQVRKFLSYYLPTTLKMLASYRRMQSRGISPRELAAHRVTLRRGLEMVNTACQKQLDNLYKENMLDISTDIDVLEQMLKRDGFIEGDLSADAIARSVDEARTAASAVMNAAQDEIHEAPVLEIPEDSPARTGYRRPAQQGQQGQ